MTPTAVVVVNTLGGTLQHYTRGLVGALAHEGGRVSVVQVDEPSAAGGSRLAWVRRYVLALWCAGRSARRSGALVIVTWPVLGHLDRVLMHLVLGRRVASVLIVHDPRPLVHARGYSGRSRRIGSLAPGVRIVVHSETAARALREDCRDVVPELLPHPVLPRATPAATVTTTTTACAPASSVSPPDLGDRPVVRVLGQFKPDRDLELLAGIGERLAGTHRLEIVGRRWPAVTGWCVTDQFVSEGCLDELLTTADAVLVPYRRFFQSGIAIRSLELGTPVVGPASSSIADLYPDDRFLTVDTVDSWCRAITAATSADPVETLALAGRAHDLCRTAWSEWLRTATAAVS